MITIADNAIRFHDPTKQDVLDGQRTAILTCKQTDIDLGADDLIALGEAMVMAGQEILNATETP